MNILILNQHSCNFGDDAAGCALVGMLLSEKQVDKIDIIYNADTAIPANDDRVFHNLDITFSKAGYFNIVKYYLRRVFSRKLPSQTVLKKWIKIIREADVVFVAPSGANIGIYKDWRFLFRLLMVVVEGKKPVFHYNTIGKSGNVVFDFLARYVLKKSEIYVREQKSYEYMNTLGLKSKMGPDTAFALDSVDIKVRENTVSFVPSSFDNWHPSFKKTPIDKAFRTIILPLIAKWATDNNYNIQILPHLRTVEEFQYNELIKADLELLGVKNVVIRNDIVSMWEYDAALASSKAVIGMRYHSIVLAAKNFRPFIALCYENKMQEVSSYMHMKGYAVNIVNCLSDGGIEELVREILHNLVKNESEISAGFKKTVDQEIKPKVKLPITEHILN